MIEQFEQMFSHIPGNYIEHIDVEKALGFAEGAIKQWICRGQMPFPYVKIRTRTRIRKDALIDWLMQNEKQPGSANPQRPTSSSSSTSSSAKKRGRPPKVRDITHDTNISV